MQVMFISRSTSIAGLSPSAPATSTLGFVIMHRTAGVTGSRQTLTDSFHYETYGIRDVDRQSYL